MSEPTPVAGSEWSAAVVHVIRHAEALGYRLVPHSVEPFGSDLYRNDVWITHGHILEDAEGLLKLLPTKTCGPWPM